MPLNNNQRMWEAVRWLHLLAMAFFVGGQLGLVVLVGVLVGLHLRRPANHALDGAIFVASLAIVWLGVALAH
jgi:hypothetical protein